MGDQAITHAMFAGLGEHSAQRPDYSTTKPAQGPTMSWRKHMYDFIACDQSNTMMTVCT